MSAAPLIVLFDFSTLSADRKALEDTPSLDNWVAMNDQASSGEEHSKVLSGSRRALAGLSMIFSMVTIILSGVPLECDNARSIKI
jgi:hypothetical protein